MKKYSRPLSIFLVLILSFSLFSVNAFAAEETENLVDSNMSNWVDYSDITSVATDISVIYSSSSNVNILSIPSTDTVSLLYDLTDFINVGEKYVFRCFFPNTGGFNSNSFENCDLTIGLVYIDDDGSVLGFVDDIEFNITYLNYSSFDNDYFELSFEIAKSVKNTAISFCFTPIFSDGMPSSQFYVSNVELVRVESETEKKLDGILGWLESIWDSITSLGDKLTDVWTNITSSVSALGDRISSFFSDLGNKITTEFTNLTSDFSGYISSLGDRISNYFTNLSVNINGFFTDLLDGIKEFFKGFGNLILYFNWEGEFENPFVYEHSLIGDFVGSGEDGEDEEEEKIEKIPFDYNSLYTSTGGMGFTNYESYSLISHYSGYIRGVIGFNTSNTSYDSQVFKSYEIRDKLPVVPFENTVVFNFTVSSFTSPYDLPWYCVIGNSYNTVSCLITGNGSYSLTLPSSPVDTSFGVKFYFIDGSPSKNSYFNIKDFGYYYVPVSFEDGSTGDTGSDEEGTTEKKSVSQFFDDLVEYLTGVSDDIETVIDSITGPVVLLDEFTKRFEWLFGIVTFVLMMIVASRFIGL